MNTQARRFRFSWEAKKRNEQWPAIPLDPQLCRLIETEILRALESGVVDVATLYQITTGVAGHGSEASTAHVLGMLVTRGDISIEVTRLGDPEGGPLIGYARLNPGWRPDWS